MIKFKTIRPFIEELAVLLFVVFLIIEGFLFTNLVEIKIKAHYLTIVAIAIVGVYFFSLFYNVVNLGLKALFDYIFQRTTTEKFTFIKQEPIRASGLLEKYNRKGQKIRCIYHLINVKKENDLYTFWSSNYADLIEGKVYEITFATSSGILLNFIPVEQ